MNGATTATSWLAAHIYYPEPLDVFLLKAVEPFIRIVLENRWADQYFYIRYWERGPHIRLRFQGHPGVLENLIKPRLEEHFYRFFQEHPLRREEPEQKGDLPEEQRWYPNMSVQYIAYEPESERYGGSHGVRIAERQFQLSSDAALAVMGESDPWDYDRALGAAIQMHLGFAFALGMDLPEAHQFYAHIYHSWFFRSYADFQKIPGPELEQRRFSAQQAFEKTFLLQKSALVNFHRMIWEAFSEGALFEEEWLNLWIAGMKKIYLELEDARRQGQLFYPAWINRREDARAQEDRFDLWLILDSLVHMTNNRLGILNRDEAYLGYLIEKSLEEIRRS